MRRISGCLLFFLSFSFLLIPFFSSAVVSMSRPTFSAIEPITWSTTAPDNIRDLVYANSTCGPLIDGLDNDINPATSPGGGCSDAANEGIQFMLFECIPDVGNFCNDSSSPYFINSTFYSII